MTQQEFKHSEVTERLIGIFFQVYNELGYGFLESVYEQAYIIVLPSQGISCQQQCPISVSFRGTNVGEFRADLLVESAVIVEMKAVQKLDLSHEKQLLNYLRATDFGGWATPQLRAERANSQTRSRQQSKRRSD